MPELPEVETVRRGLEPLMQGAIIKNVIMNRPDLRFPFPPELNQLSGIKIVSLGRRAKFLTIDIAQNPKDGPNEDTSEGNLIVCHLGMSGSFRIESEPDFPSAEPIGENAHKKGKDPKHDHLIFELSKDDGYYRVIYNDPRRFGYVQFLKRKDFDLHPSFANLGPEPLGNSLSSDYLAQKFASKKSPLKSALLDQRVIAGLGNIYVCEALWRSKLSPKRLANTLVKPNAKNSAPKAKPALEDLTTSIVQVIGEAIEAGGSSLNDYVQADGSMGYFQHRFNVYDQEGENCKRANCTGVISRIVQSGRSTFYCPECQK